MSKKKKIAVIVSSSVAAALIIALVVCIIVVPVTYSIDESLIKKNEEYSVTVVPDQKYTTLTKAYKGEDDEFKIVAFTDIHLDTYKKDGGDMSINMMIRSIVAEKPDFVVFAGDIITSSFNERRTKQFGKVMESLGVYWALCLGNHEHDNNFSITREKMIKILAGYDHCLIDASKKRTADGTEVWGNGNFVINILGKDNKISQSLYFIDSGQDMTKEQMEKYIGEVYPADAKQDYADGGEEHDYSYDYVKESQIRWYKETVDDINKLNGTAVRSTLFAHIPVPEVEQAWMEITGERYRVFDEYHEKTYDYTATSGDRILYGERRETVCRSGHNTGLFDACLEKGTQAMFFGHDHTNDCIMEYKGMILGYIKQGGFSTYNSISRKYTAKDGTKKSVEDHLVYGYTALTYSQSGDLLICSKEYESVYPELKDEMYKSLRKK